MGSARRWHNTWRDVLAVALALTAAWSWGFSAVLVRLGLRHVSTSLGTLVSLAAGLLFTGLLVAVLQAGELLDASLEAWALFAVIGILNFPAGRFFNYMAMGRLGVGRSTPLLASAPLFAVIIAVVVTGEQLRLQTAIGGALILGGLFVTLSSRAQGATQPELSDRSRTVAGVAFAFGAAIAYGSSQVLTRYSVSDLAPPLVGSFIALLWGTIGFGLLSARSVRDRGSNFSRGGLLFAGAGIFSAVGVMLMFQALSRGEVVVISPVLATNPLFTLIMAALLLRGVERITANVVVGALLVVAGVVALSVG
jgi:drug/metabolite transporter (DMT)-like permease